MISPYQSPPPEILEKIFSYLDKFSLLNCSAACKTWRNVFVMMTQPQIGYMPRVMSKVFRHLARHDVPTILAARQVCSLWQQGLDILTYQNVIRIHGKSTISSDEANQLLCWRIGKDANSNLPIHHNPFPSRTIRIQLVPDGTVSNMAMLSLTSALSIYGKHVQFLNLKIQQNIPSSSSSVQVQASSSSEPYHHRPKVYMLKLARTILQILSYMENLQGLSIYMTSELSPVEMPDQMWDEEKNRISNIKLELNKLKAVRLISWSFRSKEMEWLYYKILHHSPNLEFFDPDFNLGYEKLYQISSLGNKKPHFRFQLKCLKIAIPGSDMSQFFRLLSKMKDSLRIIHLDIFEDEGSSSGEQRNCISTLEGLIKYTGGKLTTISLSVYQNAWFVPSCGGVTSSSSVKFHPSDLSHLRAADKSQLFPNFTKFKQRIKQLGRKGRSHYHRCLRPTTSSLSFSHNNDNLRNLRLRGAVGELQFLKRFKKLERLIVLDYHSYEQAVVKEKCDFYRLLPSLKELYTPNFGSIMDHRILLMKIVEDEDKVMRNIVPLNY